jgi:hypothetical protein
LSEIDDEMSGPARIAMTQNNFRVEPLNGADGIYIEPVNVPFHPLMLPHKSEYDEHEWALGYCK